MRAPLALAGDSRVGLRPRDVAGAPGEPGLGADDGVLTHLDVVRDLDEIVNARSLANDRLADIGHPARPIGMRSRGVSRNE